MTDKGMKHCWVLLSLKMQTLCQRKLRPFSIEQVSWTVMLFRLFYRFRFSRSYWTLLASYRLSFCLWRSALWLNDTSCSKSIWIIYKNCNHFI